MRIIIIGASGLIGSELFSLAKAKGKDVIGTYQSLPKDRLTHYDMRSSPLRGFVPDLGHEDVVYLLAAYSNPAWIYNNQNISRELNLVATKRIIDEVIESGARLVFMSSVEVFNGKDGNYNEKSVPEPLNLYGKMKFEIEEYLAKSPGQFCIVRTGWNIGWNASHRCVVRLTYETLMKPNAKMASDNTFSISDVRDTAEGLLRLSKDDSLDKIHLASEPLIVRTDLADLVMHYSCNSDKMKYEITTFSEIPYSEPRAQYNHLDNLLAKERLGMMFRDPERIVRRKVELLDRSMSI